MSVPEGTAGSGGIDLLLVEDNPDNRSLIRRVLNSEGYSVIEAVNAKQAIEKLEAGNIDLILMDINMPGVKGTEILAYLRREPRLKPVPVFVITSDDQPETRREVMKLGANVMIVKPATIDALEDALRKVKFLK